MGLGQLHHVIERRGPETGRGDLLFADEQALGKLVEFLRSQHVVGLAVCDDSGPWAASCYYYFSAPDMAMVLKTSASTRHGLAMSRSSQIAGTVAGQPQQLAEIKGVQFTAQLDRLAPNSLLAECYCERHPAGRLVPGEWWRLSLLHVKYTDNQAYPGMKVVWNRDSSRGIQPASSRRARFLLKSYLNLRKWFGNV
jgi:uncharacterized protein YhbP (UPF0306 family)